MPRDSERGARDPGLLDTTLAHLRALVGFDTRNPPRAIGTGGIFDYLRGQLRGFDVRVANHGDGAVSLFAVRGRPKLLFNVHLDTVPDSPQWRTDPFELRVADDRATGLGACDIKGAAAALLAVAQASDGDMALLFTTDEEGADPRCIAHFLRTFPSPPGRRWRAAPDEGTGDSGGRVGAEPSSATALPKGEGSFKAVIVAEPTGCRAVLAHRGIQSVQVRFEGRVGHASALQVPADSALHQAVRWGSAALDFADAKARETFGNLRGLRFNLGRIEGGIKVNMIAPSADLRFGMRPLPSMDMDHLLDRLRSLVEPAPVEFRESFRGAALPAGNGIAETRQREARALAGALGIPVGEAVDFWTEAALFSQAGHTTFVYGPGDIAQAHAAGEWVALDQLDTYARCIHRIVGEGRT